MTEPPLTPPDERLPAASSAGRGGHAYRWILLVVGALAILALGVLNFARRPEPLPVIKEIPDFALTHHDGTTVTREHFAGEPWIADFIFTRCAAICPRMTAQMGHVASALGESSPVRFASFSVDPEHDTPEVLARYAAEHGATKYGAAKDGVAKDGAGDGWYFLTGGRAAIHTLSREGFMLGVETSPPADVASGDDPVIHSNRFVLVDRKNRIRGYYDPFDQAEIDRLLREVKMVLKER